MLQGPRGRLAHAVGTRWLCTVGASPAIPTVCQALPGVRAPGAGGGAVTRVSRMPTPSIIASSTPPNTADLPALRRPVRSCRKPPAGQPGGAGGRSHAAPACASARASPRWLHCTWGVCAGLHGHRPATVCAVPPLAACPPVSAPAAMLFHGSSFLRSATSVQSKVENRPPHTAKLPPMRGASRRMACSRRGGAGVELPARAHDPA